jgi:hypothetical protein
MNTRSKRRDAQRWGADFHQLFQHPLTDYGLAGFPKDWEKAREMLGDVLEPAGARKARP